MLSTFGESGTELTLYLKMYVFFMIISRHLEDKYKKWDR
jgi:hypothetical protein